ncbi:beta-ketoacyl synthase N-terminal-like domain-containing protein [Pedobacter steynii]
MAGRFPGAETINDLWDLLREGRETTKFFSDEELDISIPDHIKNDKAYVKARGVINDAEKFDSAFFGINPKLADLMDPQQRIFLEIAWEVLEKTGHLFPVYSKKSPFMQVVAATHTM